MKRISWKSINSWIMFALLLAPGLYLFGGYIGQLAGSHGEFMYAEPAIEGGVDYTVEYNENTYQRYMYTDWFLKGYNPTSTQGAILGYKEENHKLVYALNNLYSSSRNINFETPTYYLRWAGTTPGLSSYTIKEGTCFSFWQFVNSNSQYHYYEFYNLDNTNLRIIHWSFALASNGQYNEIGYTNSTSATMYFNANDDLYGKQPLLTFNFNNSRNIPENQPIIQEAPAIEPNAQGNTEFQQGQFFSRNNFLKKWGDSVVSQDETWGFAPFKALIQNLDDNMLHFAPNGVQYGLMAYGYMYYALHIVLLDLVFYITSFLPRILKKLAERLEGGLD